ncbi:MAG: hypothetical protein OXF79_19545 [Chloroflexi bacterium]|nr:hypothetical protein [Chloroflexota bacterium]
MQAQQDHGADGGHAAKRACRLVSARGDVRRVPSGIGPGDVRRVPSGIGPGRRAADKESSAAARSARPHPLLSLITDDDQDADAFRDCLYGITWSGAIGDGYRFAENGEVVGLANVVVEILPMAERTEEKNGYRVLGPAQSP